MAERLVEEVFTALDEQTVAIIGTDGRAVLRRPQRAMRDVLAAARSTGHDLGSASAMEGLTERRLSSGASAHVQ
ncbi:hypothetical protein OG930_38110 [Streptomyces sp. NBC_01799]|uniref:hypothetical protein n=1 Tax=Streptomyces sp. NBC_01800 TaxID=2975945 RepID=UPI002DD8FCC3|nr:hypothetical protein [Streptomyces sp. NBC_01800]WSA72403.1 hypothetical protein OIE65_38800 [Streptomyces sp. NBC_01800]WSA80917.1 hypothetical protein OG930_38110 [Streptomyces sp. NBC_01799]